MKHTRKEHERTTEEILIHFYQHVNNNDHRWRDIKSKWTLKTLDGEDDGPSESKMFEKYECKLNFEKSNQSFFIKLLENQS